MNQKKILILGSNVKDMEIVKAAKKMGHYTVVTDYNEDWSNSPAKYIADEAWNINWTNIEQLKEQCIINKVDGCITGFNEKRVYYAQVLSKEMGFHFYAENVNLENINNKIKFKEKCIESGIKVPTLYEYKDKIKYPVIVKPADGSGSQGITICYNNEELEVAYITARKHSNNHEVLIEEYLTLEEAMVYYIVHDGDITLSAMCDRKMKKLYNEITQLPIGYYYPSKFLNDFLEKGDIKFKKLIRKLGIKNGLIAFQMFATNDDFIPFDPTYRLDGTRSYHLTKAINDSSVLDMLINYSLYGVMESSIIIKSKENPVFSKIGFMLPILLSKGTITKVEGLDYINGMKEVFFISTRKKIGDICHEKAAFSQIFTRIHMIFNNKNEIIKVVSEIYNNLKVIDKHGKDMIIRDFKMEDLIK